MNLYLTTSNSPNGVRWAGSLAEASRQRAELKKAGHDNVGTETVDVPTNKSALLTGCFRTMKNLPNAPRAETTPAIAHNALHDALAQALHLQQIWKAMYGAERKVA